jgi:hypothetical protein
VELLVALAAEAEMVWLLFIRGNQYGSIKSTIIFQLSSQQPF